MVVVAATVAGACTRPTDSTAATSLPPAGSTSTTVDPATTSTESTSTTTVDTTTTTLAPTPTTAPPPTVPPTVPTTTEPTPTSPDDLELYFDGVLPFAFGELADDVVAGLATVLGPPVSDVRVDYPTPDEGYFIDDSTEEAYVFPHGRTVCYSNNLCVQFGAGSADALFFTGWRINSDAPPALSMANGVAVGSSWADHVDEIIIGEGGCFSVGYGDSDGVSVVLQSSGEQFLYFDTDGTAIFGDPDPSEVTVIELSAGQSPTFLFADC